MHHPKNPESHHRCNISAKLALPLLVLLGVMPAVASAQTGSQEQEKPLSAPEILEPSQILRDQTRAMTETCRAWLPTIQPSQSDIKNDKMQSPLLSPETQYQRDLCQMALEPVPIEQSFMILTIGTTWGLVLTIAVIFYILYRANRWFTAFVKQKYHYLEEQISLFRNSRK